MVIEKMLESDFKGVVKVLIESLNNEGEDWNHDTSLTHIKQNYDPEYCFVAKEENIIVGFLIGGESTMFNMNGLFLDLICVLPEYQGKGIGRKLYEEFKTLAKESGKEGFILLANPNWKSFDWYKKMGYEKTGWVELYKYFNNDD